MVGIADDMVGVQQFDKAASEVTPEAIREELELLVTDQTFRTSKRSVQFLRYVVEQTLRGASEQIKERTIGVEVFGREPSYDTGSDHVVRTAAIELRKRLAMYYSEERHRHELRVSFVPGSYVPRFTPPQAVEQTPPTREFDDSTTETPRAAAAPTFPDQTAIKGTARSRETNQRRPAWIVRLTAAIAIVVLLGVVLYRRITVQDPVRAFWGPLLDSSGPVLMAIGDIPDGPPSSSGTGQTQTVPMIPRGVGSNVPYADTVTIARVLSALQSQGKTVIMRPESSTSFSDFRDDPAVLIGAFNNEWSLRLTHGLRFSLALDAARHLIYIRDAHHPDSRNWSQQTAQTIQQQFDHGTPPRQDYALITRLWNPETGHAVVVIGGLYAYGTEAAGEFITDRSLLETIEQLLPLNSSKKTLQIVLETRVTDDTPGVAKVLAVSAE